MGTFKLRSSELPDAREPEYEIFFIVNFITNPQIYSKKWLITTH